MRSPSSSLTIICPSRERWILPLDVLGMVLGLTRSTRCRPMPAPAADTLDDLANHAAQPLDLLGALAHLGHHVEALAARPLALDAHGRRVSDARHVIHDLLDVDGDEIRAPENDEVSSDVR